MRSLLKFLQSNCPAGARVARLFFVFAFFFIVNNSYAQGDFFKNTSLIRIFSRLEKQYQVTFSYDVALVKQKRVSFFQLSNKNLKTDLIALLRDVNLGFEQLGNDIIIKHVDENYYARFNRKICGQIIDANEGLPLGHTSVSVVHTTYGKTADSLGHFVLNLPLVTSDYIAFHFIGYETKRIKMSFFLNQPCKTIFLQQQKLEVPQVIVQDDYNIYAGIKVSDIDPSVTIIRPNKMLGAGGVEPNDIFGILQQLPGVNSTDEKATSLNVRGGSSGQNLVLYDNIPLYHYGHVFGKISAFNNDLIEEVRFNKGGFSAQNGGRVASVIDIQSKKEIPKEMSIKAKVGLLSMSVSGALPFANNKAAIRIGYRKSIFENYALNQSLLKQIFQGTRVADNKVQGDSLPDALVTNPTNSFYDFFAKATWKPTDSDLIEITGLSMGDRMEYKYRTCPTADCFNSIDMLDISNFGYQVSWRHAWKPNFSTSFLYANSDFSKAYDYKGKGIDSLTAISSKRNEIIDRSMQVNTQWERNGVQVNFGVQHKKVAGLINNFKKTVIQNNSLYDNSIGITNTLFLDYRHDLGDMFHVFLGSRLSTYDLLKKRVYLEPRFSVSSNPNKYLKIKMSGGVYVQTMNLLLNADGLSERDELWILAKDLTGTEKPIFSPQRSTQLSAGVSYRRAGWQINIDLYEKNLTGVPSQIIDLQVVRPDVLGGMRASGLEIGIQKWSEHVFSILSYSKGVAEYNFESFAYTIPASYHQEHQLSLVQGIKYKNLTATVSWKWRSGLPYTKKIGILVDTLAANHYSYAIQYGQLNQGKLPNYNRLDIAMKYKHLFKWGSGTITVSALNVFNKQNILNRRYELFVSDEAQIGNELPALFSTERKGLPFTPNVSVLFEFGFGVLGRKVK